MNKNDDDDNMNKNNNKEIKVSIGTKNPAKLISAKNAFKKIFPENNIIFLSKNVPSGVRDQPLSDKEGAEGALNRAEAVFRLHPESDYSLGLEGTIEETDYGMMVYGWVIVIDNNGNIGSSCGTKLMLPEKVAERIRHGEELGPIMDDITNSKNIKHKGGTSAILTKNLIIREIEFETTTIAAMSKFISPELYNN
jgi:inosine/xanthosine triphosphatase